MSESIKIINNYLIETSEHYISYAKISIISKKQEDSQNLLDMGDEQEKGNQQGQELDFNRMINLAG